MSTENFELPDFIIADLYKNSLVILEKTSGSVVKTKPPTTTNSVQPSKTPGTALPAQPAPAKLPSGNWYLGSNNKHISILVNDPEAVFLSESSLEFLSAILGACKLNLGDVAIVNIHQTEVDYADIKEKLAPRNLLIFDLTTQQLGIPFTIPHYQVQKYDQCQILLAPALTVMLDVTQEAKLEKSRLWLSLKKIFNI